VKFCFIDEHRRHCPRPSPDRWPVSVICRVLKVTRSGFYLWKKRKPSARQVRQQKLLKKIRIKHRENRELYGSPRVHRALRVDGVQVCRNTVAKLMRQAKIRAKTRRRYVPRTTDSGHRKPIADNLLSRDFAAAAPNQKWLADITYVPTDEDWLFLAGVLDCFSRRIVGWSMCEGMPTDLASDALKMALLHRQPGRDLLHHSDRGAQYASEDYQQLLIEHGIAVSMSGRGNCYDNAMMESFWATLKTELIYQQNYATREEARQSIFEYIEVFYNRKRLHSSLGYQSPEAFEAA
jgi:putative transposase